MIKIHTSRHCAKEKKYIFDVILNDFLGLDYTLHWTDKNDIVLCLDNGHTLTFKSVLLECEEGYLSQKYMPRPVFCNNPHSIENDFVCLYGDETFSQDEKTIKSGFDLFGSCFFMLSRMEEAIISKRDKHDRFAGQYSVAYIHGFIERPIIDEYTEMLWEMIKYLYPDLSRKKIQFQQYITCDVDWPYDPIRRSLKRTLRASVKSFLSGACGRSFKLIKNYIAYRAGVTQQDENVRALYWMMDENEKHNNKMCFFFIPYETSAERDLCADLEHENIKTLWLDILSRGHEIGVHPGYECYKSAKNFKASVDFFNQFADKHNVSVNNLGCRMHYLRYDILQTPRLMTQNGIAWDSSLSYADVSGFRCGTCHSFLMFDLLERETLPLRQRPLITMEHTILSSAYENKKHRVTALERFMGLKQQCNRYDGEYILLWHNNSLVEQRDREIYKKLISSVAS